MAPTSDEPTHSLTTRLVPQSVLDWVAAHPGNLAGFAIVIDRFDAVWQVLGPEAAETLGRTVLDRLRVWAADGYAESLGGPRFVAVLPAADDPVGAAARLPGLVAEPVQLAGLTVSRSASVGMAIDVRGELPIETLLGQAGRACAAVRAAGGDGAALYDPDADAERTEESRLDLELHEGLVRGQLVLHYQPEFDLATGQVLAVEALLRWQHPRRGLLHAGDFIDATETTRTFSAVQQWVFDECCRRLAAWTSPPLAGLMLRTNVSGTRLAQTGTADVLLSALEQHGVAPHRLCVEVTETQMPRDLDALNAQVRRLRATGMSVALDDIGTGQSTTTQLRVLPVDTVKLDRSFTENLAADARTEPIVAGIIRVAHSLGVHVVAEGVDGPDTAATLMRLGCHRAQGDALAPAVPETELPAVVRGGLQLRPDPGKN